MAGSNNMSQRLNQENTALQKSSPLVGCWKKYMQPLLILAAIASSLTLPKPASAAELDFNAATPVGGGGAGWPTQTLNSTATQISRTYLIGGVYVRLTWTLTASAGTAPTLQVGNNLISGLNGGIGTDGQTLDVLYDPFRTADTAVLNVEYLNNPVPAGTAATAADRIPVEDARLIVIDIDRNALNPSQWQDRVILSGSLGGSAVNFRIFAATAPPSAPPTTSPTALANDYTVALNQPTNTLITSVIADGIFPPAGRVAADNASPNGTIIADYTGSAVDRMTLTYTDDPAVMGVGGAPIQHGIGIYNISFRPAIIGIAKQAGTPIANPNGTFTVPYTLVVTNLGETRLDNVQVTEDLTTTFANAGGFAVSNSRIVTAPAGFSGTINTSFNGSSSILLLSGSNAARTLAGGESLTLAFDVTITPGSGANGYGTFNNTALATAQSPTGATVRDTSTNGANPDPNGDNNPSEQVVTPVNLPAIGVAKQVTNVQTVAGQPNALDVTYSVVVSNFGNEALNNVQLVEPLIDPTTSQPTFGAGNFTIVGAPTRTAGAATVTGNPGFNAVGDQNLLAGGSTLAVGTSATITFTVRVTNATASPPLPSTPPALYRNQITARGTGQNSGVPVEDLSTNGSSADPNADGNPRNDSVATPVRLPPIAVIGVAKRVVSATANPAGAFGANTVRIIYEVVVENFGGQNLTNVQLTENLNTTFGAGSFAVQNTQITVAPPAGSTITLNAGFNGNADQNLLGVNNNLLIGASATIRFTVDVNTASATLPSPLPGPYNNQITASGDGPGGTVQDVSNNGTQAAIDQNGNGNPNDDSSQTPVSFGGNLQIVKRITNVFRNGAPLTTASLGVNPAAVFNDGTTTADDDLIAASGNQQPQGAISIPISLQSGDQIEYTVYFFNIGALAASNTRLCDTFQSPTTFVASSETLSPAVAFPGPLGAFVAPAIPAVVTFQTALTPLRSFCIGAPGNFPSGGGIILEGNGAGGSGFTVNSNSVGALRYRVQVP